MFEHKFLLCFGIIDKDCIQNARPKADTTLMYYQRTYSMVWERKETKGENGHKNQKKTEIWEKYWKPNNCAKKRCSNACRTYITDIPFTYRKVRAKVLSARGQPLGYDTLISFLFALIVLQVAFGVRILSVK